jgi:glycosyltransferase involved in cell wall biosynthesis
MKILHLAAHMGGGIGSAYAGLGTCGLQQTVVLLEMPIDKVSLAKVEAEGFQIIIQPDMEQLHHELKQADIVVFNWTHHPALTKLMVEFPNMPVRGILWCHVSGNYFPHIHPEFLKIFNHILFATTYSQRLPQILKMGDKYINENTSVVYGLGDIGRFAQVKNKPHDKFVIGYVGTLGFSKLNPDFVEYCAAVDIPNVEFRMAGTPSTKEKILKAADKYGIADKFVFCGQTDNIPAFLAETDVFGYLLNPQHFGATENALLEAMAAGIPCIALNQCVESVIIKDGETGLLADSPQSYRKAIRQLFEDKTFSERIGKQAQEDILNRFDISKNRACFIENCNYVMNQQKKAHNFNNFFGEKPADWFLSCVEKDRQCFLENRAQDAGLIFHEPTKGSPRHYNTYFPEDERLALWAGQLNTIIEIK